MRRTLEILTLISLCSTCLFVIWHITDRWTLEKIILRLTFA